MIPVLDLEIFVTVGKFEVVNYIILCAGMPHNSEINVSCDPNSIFTDGRLPEIIFYAQG